MAKRIKKVGELLNSKNGKHKLPIVCDPYKILIDAQRMIRKFYKFNKFNAFIYRIQLEYNYSVYR